MRSFYRNRFSSKTKFFIYFLIGAIITSEYLIFYIKRLQWKNINSNNETATRILFIADCQLLGDEFDSQSSLRRFLEYIKTYDSDRNLAQSYRHALAHSKPDIIVFLGDLYNDGSISNDPQFASFLERFQNIFPIPSNVNTVMIAGDNDIGGEQNEMVKPSKVHRFKKTFKEREVWKFRNKINFYHINRITHELPHEPESQEVSDNTYTRILISHMPLLNMPGQFTKKAVDRFKPHIIFSGHQHRSTRIRSEPGQLRYSSTYLLQENEYAVSEFDLHAMREQQELLEISVPTPNYRMGATHIGYSLAVFQDGMLSYTVLWVPHRFNQIRFYLVFFPIFIIALIFQCCNFRRLYRRTRSYLPL